MWMLLGRSLKFFAVASAMIVGSATSSNADVFPLSGKYNFSINGSIVFDVPSNEVVSDILIGLQVPTASVGSFEVNRRAVENLRATYNIGGCAILQLSGEGRYTFNRQNRTGNIRVTTSLVGNGGLTTINEQGAYCGAILAQFSSAQSDTAIFSFEFVVNQRRANADQVIDLIGLTQIIPPPQGPRIFIPSTSTGIARPVL